jgi:hypothetical protein
MKKTLFSALVLAAVVPSGWATVSYNENITAIFGGGNPDTGWTADSGANGLQLALRAKIVANGNTANASGTYSYATPGIWNYEFSINSGASLLSTYDYYLAVDRDPSAGVNFGVVTPLSYWVDNSYGDSSTANGAGVEGTAATYASTYHIAQASQKITFGDYPGGALGLDANATYSYELYAVEKNAGIDGAHLADVDITVVVGAGGVAAAPSVPDAGSTCMLLGMGFAGLVGLRRKFAA